MLQAQMYLTQNFNAGPNVANNHNDEMNFDPVDGRDLRGRGRSRDTSSNRLFGMQVVNSPMTPAMNFNGMVKSQQNMDINEQMANMNIAGHPFGVRNMMMHQESIPIFCSLHG